MKILFNLSTIDVCRLLHFSFSYEIPNNLLYLTYFFSVLCRAWRALDGSRLFVEDVPGSKIDENTRSTGHLSTHIYLLAMSYDNPNGDSDHR